MNFFVVDDDSYFIDVVTVVLEAAGHSVSGSVSGLQALSQIQSAKPDCVLVDLMMSGLDGLDLCREIRKKKELNATQIIFVSARKGDHWREQARETGAIGYIAKPIDTDTFAAQVAETLESEAPAGLAPDTAKNDPPASY